VQLRPVSVTEGRSEARSSVIAIDRGKVSSIMRPSSDADFVEVDLLDHHACFPRKRQDLADEGRAPDRRLLDRGGAPAEFGRVSVTSFRSEACPMMIPSMLLKSWAIPPARVPRDSSFCDWRVVVRDFPVGDVHVHPMIPGPRRLPDRRDDIIDMDDPSPSLYCRSPVTISPLNARVLFSFQSCSTAGSIPVSDGSLPPGFPSVPRRGVLHHVAAVRPQTQSSNGMLRTLCQQRTAFAHRLLERFRSMAMAICVDTMQGSRNVPSGI